MNTYSGRMFLLVVVWLESGCAGPPNSETKGARDNEKTLSGRWTVVSLRCNGASFKDVLEGSELDVDERFITVMTDKEAGEKWEYKLRPTDTPSSIDLINKDGGLFRGIYAWEKGNVKICYRTERSADRPDMFESKENSRTGLLVLKRKE